MNTSKFAERGNRRVLLAALWLVFVLAPGASGEAHEGHPPLPTQGAAVHGDELLLSPGAHQALGIETAKVTLEDLPATVRANGTVRIPWQQQAVVVPLLPATVEQVRVSPGDAVTAGQVLADLSSLELERLQLEMLEAETKLSLARRLLRQHESAAEIGGLAGKALVESRKARDEAAVRLNVAVRKLKTLGFSDEDLETVRSTGETLPTLALRSPIGGVVSDAEARVGQAVLAAEPLFRILDPATVWCVAEVLETDSGRVAAGQRAEVVFAAVDGPPLRGTVARVGLPLDPIRRSLPAAIEIDNSDGRLRPGMSGRIEIEVAQSEQAVVCPGDALIRAGDGHAVLLKRGVNKYVRKDLELGRRTPRGIEVLDGLFPGDQVVTVGRNLLASLFHEHEAQETPSRPASTRDSGRERPSFEAAVPALRAQGTVELPRDAKAYAASRIDGRVRRLLAGPGDRVEAGQVLAEVESLDLHDLQLGLLQALIELRWKEATAERLTPLAGELNPQSDLWTVTSDVRRLRHQIGSLQRRLIRIGVSEKELARLERVELADPDQPALAAPLPVRAPLSGRIAGLSAVSGESVGPDDRLFEIHDLSTVWVKAFVFEEDATRVGIGGRVEVAFAAESGLTREGRVVRRAPAGSVARRAFPLWIEVDNSDGLLREGMTASVTIPMAAARPERFARGAAASPRRSGE